MKRILLCLLFLSVALTNAFAQNRRISGKVTSAQDGTPLPGVSVVVLGTNIGTQTSISGEYTLNIPAKAQELVFSAIGYAKTTVKIGAQSTYSVKLAADAKQLAEVNIVVPYGTVKKEAVTGAVSTVSARDLEKRSVTNITSALAGAAPGIAVGASNGQPGNSAAVRIRGFGSISASNTPLYVLDGSPYDGNIGDINVADIDNVSILKDASSTALYGSRASNGVIMITTKKGKTAKPTLSANLNQGYTVRGIPEYDRLDAYQYYPAVWQAIKNNLMFSATTPQNDATASANASATVATNLVYNPFNVSNATVVGTDGKLNPNAQLLYNDFDWYKPVQRTGKRTDASLSASGRTENSNYYVSMGYLSDKGYILASDFQRFNARINVETKINKWLKTGLNLSGSTSQGNTASDAATGNGSSFINPFSFARSMGPIYPVHAFDANGNPIINTVTGQQLYDYGQYTGAVNRPQGASPGRNVVLETMLNTNVYRREALGARTFVEVKFLKDFTFTPSFSVDYRDNNTINFQNPTVGDGAGTNGNLQKTNATTRSYTFNQLLAYNKTFGKHSISALASHENYDYTYNTFYAYRTSIIAQGITELDNFVTSVSSGGNTDLDRMESYLGKASYSYDDKYFFDASIRRDASSRFAPESRWGSFYSLGGAWSIYKEKFMANTSSWLDELRLKVGYGQVGNRDLPGYYLYDAYYDTGFNNNSQAGILLSSLANRSLTWESQNTLNAGVTFSFFKRRLYGEFNWFNKSVDRMLFAVPQPLSDPVTTINQNVGAMSNKGFELQLGADLVRTKDFSWNLLTNWTAFKNKITKMPVETPVVVSGTKRLEVGHDIYAYWLRQYAGVDPSDGSALYIPADGTAASSMRTVNGVQYVTNQSLAKFAYSGTAIPDLIGSFTNTFSYKGLSLSVLVNYQIGGKAYDAVYQGLMSTGSYGAALHKDILQSWTPSNPTATIPRADFGATTNTNATSSRWLVDASYWSVRNLSLSYALPKSLLSKVNIQNARVFLNGENLHLFSKRKGLNPTESFDGVNANTYVESRLFSFGVNFSL